MLEGINPVILQQNAVSSSKINCAWQSQLMYSEAAPGHLWKIVQVWDGPENWVYRVCVQGLFSGEWGSYRGGFCVKVPEASSESKRANGGQE